MLSRKHRPLWLIAIGVSLPLALMLNIDWLNANTPPSPERTHGQTVALYENIATVVAVAIGASMAVAGVAMLARQQTDNSQPPK